MTTPGIKTVKAPHLLEAGEYCFKEGDGWYGCTPNGLLSTLRNHQVVENGDGTITASPSILTSNGEGGLTWHGYLEDGVWREC